MRLTSKITNLLKNKSYKPSSAEQIYKQLKEPTLGAAQFEKALNILISENHIQIVDNKFIAKSKRPDIIQGQFSANTKGFGFVLNPEGDIFIRSDKVNGAMHGDKVEVRVQENAKRKKNIEGRIVKIIEHSLTQIIGRVEIRGESSWLIPSDRRLKNMFLVTSDEKLNDGQMIVGNITKYPPQGCADLSEILGDENTISVEIEVIVRSHNLRMDWPSEATEQASTFPDMVYEVDLADRKDYRNEYSVTIDGLDAKDFDDAVSVIKKNNKYHLKVHIADVSHYVKVDSPLDIEARLRGNSTYLADRVIPMFPFELSNNLASLNPKVDRLTVSVEAVINENGDVESFEINKGVINSKARLTYEEVDEALNTNIFNNNEEKELLSLLNELHKIIEKKRLRKGSLLFETIEPKVILDKDLNPIDIVIRQRTKATSIIEDMMITANEVVAKYMSKRKYPLIYRNHEEPAEDALSELEGLLLSFNYPVQELKNVEHKTYQNLLNFAKNRPDKLLINSVLIRSMQKAKYSATHKSHYGLALDYYCHFTSPIRRYADLVVHRQIKKMLKKDFSFDEEQVTKEFQEMADEITATEIESTASERDSADLLIAWFMQGKVGEKYEAIITGVTTFGLFVQIPNSAEGLVHITALKDDYYVFEPEKYLVRGNRTNKVYRLGQKINVELTRVVVGERQLDFQIIE